jgi:CTP synthase (UTP-ammonia lyase)
VTSGSDGLTIAIIGDRNPAFPTHLALDRAADRLPHGIGADWIATEELGPRPAERLARVSGLWIAPGSSYRSEDGALRAIRHGWETGLPLLGT